MSALLVGPALFGAALAAHLVLWRIYLPARQTRALLVLMAGLPLVALAASALGVLPLPGLAGLAAHIEAGLFVLAFALAYVITYSGLEADSPTLVIVLAIDSAGPEGLPLAALDAALSDERLLLPRLRDLLRDGLARMEGGRYAITTKGKRFVRIFALYRGLLGLGRRGG